MQIKEVTIRKARRSTVKSVTGNYDMNEADVTLTVEAVDGQNPDTAAVIAEVKKLVEQTLDNTKEEDKDPDWINERQPNEPISKAVPAFKA